MIPLEKVHETNERLSYLENFVPKGSKLLLRTNAGYLESGDVLEAETRRGGRNYIIFFMSYNGFVYYVHGDKAKKAPESHFQKLIDYGDIQFVPRNKVDIERLSLSVLNLSAMANGLQFNDYLKAIYGYGNGTEVNHYGSQL